VPQPYVDIATHLGAAWLAGSLIGLERSFHGRPAGFRTHALVCLASALLMIVTAHQWDWLGAVPLDTVRTDPTRIAQGIMTGIGFLGAGVIFKEGLSVRGLTTAASIWITAAIGILYGVGLFFPVILATSATLGTLAIFRWVEARMPSQHFALHVLRFGRDHVMTEEDLTRIIAEHGLHNRES
jgi:putative Mg2+ transporter-C (MgtC) family protein